MPRITTVGPDARARLTSAGAGKAYRERQPYREALANLSGDAMLEIEPEQGETMRRIKLRLSRAAKEAGREIRYGDTTDGKLLAWLAEPTRRRRRRRGRTDSAAEFAEPTPQNAPIDLPG